ncbi:hypothetical protein [Candidatus Methylocalor cossyra]
MVRSFRPPTPGLLRRMALIAWPLGLSGCPSPPTLHGAVLAYDRAATQLGAEQLLLNIARARHHQPMHFTGVSNIAATYNYTLSAGMGPALTGDTGSLLVPSVSGTVADNPTFSIVPIEGEEFTKRLLTPFQESKLTMLLRQGTDVDLLLRLLASELRIRQGDQQVAYANRPADRRGYTLFRQVVAHLSSIQDRNALYLEPLIFRESWTVPAATMTPETLQAVYKEFDVKYQPATHSYQLTRRVTGRIIITNYDPDVLTDQERMQLNAEAEQGPPDEVLLDIRAGFVGGEYPLHGKMRLRSFQNVLNFIGRGIVEEPEYPVPLDPRTPPISENPARTLDIVETHEPPPGADLVVPFNGHYYAVRPDVGYQWNREAFRLLYQLYQMTITELPQFGVPSITISK